MEKSIKVTCKECGEKFEARFDTQEKDKIPMAFCPKCQEVVVVLSREFAQYTT